MSPPDFTAVYLIWQLVADDICSYLRIFEQGIISGDLFLLISLSLISIFPLYLWDERLSMHIRLGFAVFAFQSSSDWL